jgi:hypothetical protein
MAVKVDGCESEDGGQGYEKGRVFSDESSTEVDVGVTRDNILYRGLIVRVSLSSMRVCKATD